MKQSKLGDLDAFFEVLRSIFSSLEAEKEESKLSITTLRTIAEKSPEKFVFLGIPLLHSSHMPQESKEKVLRMVDRAVIGNCSEILDAMSPTDLPNFIGILIEAHVESRDANTAITFLSAIRCIVKAAPEDWIPMLINFLTIGPYSLLVASSISDRYPSRVQPFFEKCFDHISKSNSALPSEVVAISSSLQVMKQDTSMSEQIKQLILKSTTDSFKWLSSKMKPSTIDFILRGACSGLALIDPEIAANLTIYNTSVLSSISNSLRPSTRLLIVDSFSALMLRLSNKKESALKFWASFLPLISRLSYEVSGSEQSHISFLEAGYQLSIPQAELSLLSLAMTPSAIASITLAFVLGRSKPYEASTSKAFNRVTAIYEKPLKEDITLALLNSISKVVTSTIIPKKQFWQMLHFVASCDANSFLWMQQTVIKQMAQSGCLPQKVRFKQLCKLIRRPNLWPIRSTVCSIAAEIIPNINISFEKSFFVLIAFLLIEMQRSIDIKRPIDSEVKILLYVLEMQFAEKMKPLEDEVERNGAENMNAWRILEYFSSMLHNSLFAEMLANVYLTLFTHRQFSSADFSVSLKILKAIIPFPSRSFIYSLFLPILSTRATSELELRPSFMELFCEVAKYYTQLSVSATRFVGLQTNNYGLFFQMVAGIILSSTSEAASIVKDSIMPVFSSRFTKIPVISLDFPKSLKAVICLGNSLHGQNIPEAALITNHLLLSLGELLITEAQRIGTIGEEVFRDNLSAINIWMHFPPLLNSDQVSFILDSMKSRFLDRMTQNDEIIMISKELPKFIPDFKIMMKEIESLMEFTISATEMTRIRILSVVKSLVESSDKAYNGESEETALKTLAYAAPLSGNPKLSHLSLGLVSDLLKMINSVSVEAEEIEGFIQSMNSGQLSFVAEFISTVKPISDLYTQFVQKVVKYLSPVFGDREIALFKTLVNNWVTDSSIRPKIVGSIRTLVQKNFDSTLPIIVSQARSPIVQDLFSQVCEEKNASDLSYSYLLSALSNSSEPDIINGSVNLLNRLFDEQQFSDWADRHVGNLSQSIIIAVWKVIVGPNSDDYSLQNAFVLLEKFARTHQERQVPHFVVTKDTDVVQVFEELSTVISEFAPPVFVVMLDPLFRGITQMDSTQQQFLLQLLSISVFKMVKKWGGRPLKEIIITVSNFSVCALNILRNCDDPTPVITALRRVFWASPNIVDLIPTEIGGYLFREIVSKFRKEASHDFLFSMEILCPTMSSFEEISEGLQRVLSETMKSDIESVRNHLLSTFGKLSKVSQMKWIFKDYESLVYLMSEIDNESARAILMVKDKETGVCEAIKNAKANNQEFKLNLLIDKAFEVAESGNKKAKSVISSILQGIGSMDLSRDESEAIRTSLINKINSTVKWEKDISIRTLPLLV